MAAESKPITMDRWVLTQRPQGKFDATRDVAKRTEPIPELKKDDVLVEVEMLSVDAFVRTMLDEQAYHGRVEIGGAVPALGYGTVVGAGADAQSHIGKRVLGMVTASSHAVGPMSMSEGGFTQVLSIPGVPQRLSLSLLSFATGLAAYIGCFKVLKPPKAGETAVVSAAAGGVGSIAVQLLKTTGCRVVGVAGGPVKCEFLKRLGCDAAVDYKAGSFLEDLDGACPDGVNFFFDKLNVIFNK